MGAQGAFHVGGYVLAGGRSSRMGTDKALLELGGKPLIEHAVGKLRRLCAEVHILSSNAGLAQFAPLVPDIHPGCGPIGGMEAALLWSTYDWNVFLAVDMPFLPTAFIQHWMREWMAQPDDGARVRMFTADGRPQPGFCVLHKEVAPFLFAAIRQDEFKLMPVFEAAGRELADRRGLPAGRGLWNRPVPAGAGAADVGSILPAQRAAEHLWFANLNTLEDFAEAEANLDALDR